jgi:hypothetical protein
MTIHDAIAGTLSVRPPIASGRGAMASSRSARSAELGTPLQGPGPGAPDQPLQAPGSRRSGGEISVVLSGGAHGLVGRIRAEPNSVARWARASDVRAPIAACWIPGPNTRMGPFQAPWVIWVIRLTSPHLP